MPEDILSVCKRTEGLIQKAFRLLNVPTPAVSTDKIEKVVVILGSSRSGSSLLFHQLSQSGAFWTAQGEETPFYRLAGLGWIHSAAESDALKSKPREEELCIVREALLRDLGRGPADVDDRYMAQAVARILLQWPEREWDLSELIFAAHTCLDGSAKAWPAFLEALDLNVSLYDGLSSAKTSAFDPRFVFEEPPFIAQVPRRTPEKWDAPLLLKTSSNVYRPELLRALFPKAEFKFILLTRNPAAAINGLMDGWLSPGFHSHRVGDFAKLAIGGYSELHPSHQDWWKFDLPPGWGEYVSRDLVEVCAFQWSSAYRHALDIPGEKLTVRFEDVQSGTPLDSIFQYCGVAPTPVPGLHKPIMSSQPPAPGRWRQRRQVIEPLLQDSTVQTLARELGYNLSSLQDLI